ncbi:hypothetical protein D7D52_28305 [Nocardia yunnanensis]|uniref:YncE family protein n=1 Tax=Nocardia yunnanensis TaxID=2382165 RepID=A0A386ZHU9_9NOCA|nr:hypothetical protein [Nocardia yunnanensis]AYF77066.1 hypothetical protein D7D52_28305 [Nocardia yunnanensis]
MAVDSFAHKAIVANTSDGTVAVVDLVAQSLEATIPVGPNLRPTGVAVDPGLRFAYVVSSKESVDNSSTLSIIDLSVNRVTATIPTGKNSSGVAVDTGTHTVFVVDTDDSKAPAALSNHSFLTIVDPVRQTIVDTVQAGIQAMSMVIDPVTHYGYLASYSDASVVVVDTVTHTVDGSIPVGSMPYAVALDTSAHTLYVPSAAGVALIDTTSRARTAVIDPGCDVHAITVDPTVHRAYTACLLDNHVQVIDPVSGAVAESLEVKTSHGLAVDPKTHTLYVHGIDKLAVIKR